MTTDQGLIKKSKKRKVKGNRVKPSLKSFNCMSCGAPVKVEVVGHTLNVVCPNCRAIIDARDPNFKILQKVNSARKEVPYLKIGSKGKLKGKLWQVTGFLVKSDSGYYWREYLLYNPYHGYRWLVEVDGHWVLYKKVYRAVDDQSDSAHYKGKKFKLFNKGTAKVRYVEGEFYWRIKIGDEARVADYISPPEALSVEITKDEENWSLGYSIEAETIRRAFGVTRQPPFAKGVGMIQPSPVKKKLQEAMKPMTTALIALFLIFVMRGITASNNIVFSDRYDYKVYLGSREPVKTREFDIKGGSTNIQLQGYANVVNSWVFIEGLLVDADTQKGIPLPLEISFYRGSDWKEGSKTNDHIINNVPPGRYYLSFNFRIGPTPPKSYIELTVRRDVPINSNFIFACILIIIAPFFTFISSRNFEAQRWSNSDYNPYSED